MPCEGRRKGGSGGGQPPPPPAFLGANFIHFLYNVTEISAKKDFLKLTFKTTPPPPLEKFLPAPLVCHRIDMLHNCVVCYDMQLANSGFISCKGI